MRMGILGFLGAAAVAAAPAFADIAKFNAAVQVRDFRSAALEAASTWPELDKARPDIASIAREFGFVSYLAGDTQAAKTYASFMVENTAGVAEQASLWSTGMVLLRLAELKTDNSARARDRLADALAARVTESGVDNITFLGANTLVSRDFEQGKWAEAEQSAALAAKVTASAGTAFFDARRRFELFGHAAQYMRAKDRDSYLGMVVMQNRLANDIDNAPSDEAAAKLAPIYWEARAWAESMGSHMNSRGKSLGRLRPGEPNPAAMAYPHRSVIPQDRADRADCPTRTEMIRRPTYPESALFAGFVGTVILKVDIDAKGLASNPTVLSAVPEKDFGETAIEAVGSIRIKPAPGYEPGTCSLEQKDRVVEFVFTFGN